LAGFITLTPKSTANITTVFYKYSQLEQLVK